MRRLRLAVLERRGLAGAAQARNWLRIRSAFLANCSGGHHPELRRPAAGKLFLALVVVVTTYLTMVSGELVPKHLALRRPEQMAARGCSADRLVGSFECSSIPVVSLLDKSSAAVCACSA